MVNEIGLKLDKEANDNPFKINEQGVPKPNQSNKEKLMQVKNIIKKEIDNPKVNKHINNIVGGL